MKQETTKTTTLESLKLGKLHYPTISLWNWGNHTQAHRAIENTLNERVKERSH